jgi:hypothetical protein
MAGFDGVAKKGKTVGKQLGIDGPKVPSMKAVGRNMARVMNQKRSGRGG